MLAPIHMYRCNEAPGHEHYQRSRAIYVIDPRIAPKQSAILLPVRFRTRTERYSEIANCFIMGAAAVITGSAAVGQIGWKIAARTVG